MMFRVWGFYANGVGITVTVTEIPRIEKMLSESSEHETASQPCISDPGKPVPLLQASDLTRA
jgi:hypothetical protein